MVRVLQIVGKGEGQFCLYENDKHEFIREHFTWLSVLDKNSERREHPVFITLRDIEDEHLEALIRFTEEHYPDYINNVFVNEKTYREENKC